MPLLCRKRTATSGAGYSSKKGVARARLISSPAGASFDEVQHRQPVDDDEVVSAGFSDALNNRNREAHPVLIATTPLVFPGSMHRIARQ